MLRNIILFSVLSFYSVTTNAQELENSLLWEISGKSLAQSSYLFGTIHMTCDATLNDRVTQALDETKLIVLELDLDDPTMQMSMMKHMSMKDDKTLKDLLSEKEYNKLNSFYKEQFGIDLQAMNKVKPFFLSAMIYPKLLDCPMESFEIELVKVAKAQNEEILGLETVEEQMNIFDIIPYEDQLQDLLKSANDNLNSDKEIFTKMMKIYNEEDINAMVELINEDKTLSSGKHADKLLINRNKNWVPKIIEFAEEKPTFFGVGAGHLGGEFGVINLLRKLGYQVTPVL